MHLPLNTAPAWIMHIDMNACFARAEQQAWPRQRDKPLGVTPVNVPGGATISPSYELKALGVKTGMRNRDVKLLAPDVILKESNPALYREVHRRFCRIFRDYSPDVVPKSIDEAVIDFSGTPALRDKSMEEIGREIKERVKAEIGEWMLCNVGIGPNRFLAKVAAGLNKPDGLDRIDHTNLREVFAGLKLIDLPGINVRYQARLSLAGITTPLQFLDADAHFLKTQVFQSIEGYYWSQKLHGYEVDSAEHARGGYTNSVQLARPEARRERLLCVLDKLSHKASTRMRRDGYGCRSIGFEITLADGEKVGEHLTLHQPVLAKREILPVLKELLDQQEQEPVRVRTQHEGREFWRHEMMVTRSVSRVVVWLDKLVKGAELQGQLLDDEQSRARRLSQAEDLINWKYGLYTIGSPRLLGMNDIVVDRIPFGSPQDMEELYSEEKHPVDSKGKTNEDEAYGVALTLSY